MSSSWNGTYLVFVAVWNRTEIQNVLHNKMIIITQHLNLKNLHCDHDHCFSSICLACLLWLIMCFVLIFFYLHLHLFIFSVHTKYVDFSYMYFFSLHSKPQFVPYIRKVWRWTSSPRHLSQPLLLQSALKLSIFPRIKMLWALLWLAFGCDLWKWHLKFHGWLRGGPHKIGFQDIQGRPGLCTTVKRQTSIIQNLLKVF